MRKWVSSLTVVLVATAGAGACRSARPAGGADLALDGRAVLTSTSGKNTPLFRSVSVDRGQTVRITRGTAVLHLSQSRTIEMRQGSAIKIGTAPSVVAGDALLVAEDGRLAVHAAGSTVAVTDGAARVTRDLAVHTGTYRGAVTITSAGRRYAVPALREATIPSLGVPPSRAIPIRLKRSDAWDRRFLGDAIELNEQLQARSEGLSGQLPRGQGRSVGFVETLLPDLRDQSSFGSTFLNPERMPGETIVGAAIALAGKTGSFGERWLSVFSFRDDGADWGLVAVDQRINDVLKLSTSIDAALARAESFTYQVAAPAPVPTDEAWPSPPSATTPVVTQPSTTTRPSPSDNSNGKTAATDTPPTTSGPLTGVVDTVDNVVSGLLSTLLGQ